MNAADRTSVPTSRGDVCCAQVRGAIAYRVGYPPTSWEWTPWEFATDGRFTGRWDDPAGVWRTLYVGDDEDEFPTIAPGRVPRSWMSTRVTGSGAISGWFVVPGDAESVARR
ncbi:hypothetical protein ACFWB0_03605 [Rhodococcus sp. NPDC060086]|uniref:hypothetical protein n=1 Tax=Rhodococcus sp. NPDC060086 TaxID=3347055 RepID=UPI00364DE80F